jgi:SAM-dependent methyltransferase
MNQIEYKIMAGVEDTHWWYRGLRGIISVYTNLYCSVVSPKTLDVGCGTGANMDLMRTFGPVTGLDLSTEALRHSKSRGLDHLCQGNALRLPYADESFDVVLLMDVLYHRAVPDKVAPLKEALRVLKPGGILLVNVPAFEWLLSTHDIAVHTDQRFVRREVQNLLHEADFTVETTTYWNMLLFPILVLLRKLRPVDHEVESDLSGYRESFSTHILNAILGLERILLRITPLPIGSSIFAVGRKTN